MMFSYFDLLKNAPKALMSGVKQWDYYTHSEVKIIFYSLYHAGQLHEGH